MNFEKAHGSVATLSKTPLSLERKRSGHAFYAGDSAGAEADRCASNEVSHPTRISCALLARWSGLVLLGAGAEGAMCRSLVCDSLPSDFPSESVSALMN